MTSGRTDPGRRFVRLAETIRAERDRTHQVVGEAQEALADFADRPPPLRERRGIGAIVHDFYTGLERTFERIAAELDGGIPAGSNWHRELLASMALDLPGVRPRVVSRETERALAEYLRFRHLFRNRYGFELDWERLRPLVERVSPTWQVVLRDLEGLLEFLDTAATPPHG